MWDLCEFNREESIRDVTLQRYKAIQLSKQFGVGEKTKTLYEKEAERWEHILFLLKEYPAIMALAVTLKTVEDDYKNVEAN